MPFETHKDYDFDFDSECVIDDFVTILEILGVTVGTRRGGSGRTIYYSGFWNQGDGASFEGRYRYAPGALAKLKAEFPTETTLHNIAKRLTATQRKCFYAATADIRQSGNYSHEYTMSIYEMGFDEYGNREREYYHADAEAEILEAMRDLARWLYRRLEEAYEYGASYAMGRYVAEKKNDVAATRKELLTVLKDYRPIRKACPAGNSLCDVIQQSIKNMCNRIERLRSDIEQTLSDNRTDKAYEAGFADYINA